METLTNYIENLLKWTRQTPENALTFFNQAFGAMQFYIIEHNLHNAEYTALETLWNESYRPQFMVLITGGDKNA